MLISRSSRSQIFFKIGVLKNFAKLEPLFYKVAGSVIKRPTDSTTGTMSGQTDTTSGQTSTTSGQTSTTNGQTSTTSGKTSTTSG